MDDIITYLLIFSLVVLLCYTLFYLYNIYYGSCPAHRAHENFAEAPLRAVVVGSTRCGWTIRQKAEWDTFVKTWTRTDRIVPDAQICMVDTADACGSLASKHGVNSYPTLLLLRGDGTLVSKSPGYKDADALSRTLNVAL